MTIKLIPKFNKDFPRSDKQHLYPIKDFEDGTCNRPATISHHYGENRPFVKQFKIIFSKWKIRIVGYELSGFLDLKKISRLTVEKFD